MILKSKGVELPWTLAVLVFIPSEPRGPCLLILEKKHDPSLALKAFLHNDLCWFLKLKLNIGKTFTIVPRNS